MARLIKKNAMKQWVQDGVVMCGYRSIKVGQEDANTDETTIKKDGLVLERFLVSLWSGLRGSLANKYL